VESDMPAQHTTLHLEIKKQFLFEPKNRRWFFYFFLLKMGPFLRPKISFGQFLSVLEIILTTI